jgi:hypothetical protein
MEEGSLPPELKSLLRGVIHLLFAPWRIFAVLLVISSFFDDFDETGFISAIGTAILLFIWDGPKTMKGYIIAVVISITATGLLIWAMRL